MIFPILDSAIYGFEVRCTKYFVFPFLDNIFSSVVGKLSFTFRLSRTETMLEAEFLFGVVGNQDRNGTFLILNFD